VAAKRNTKNKPQPKKSLPWGPMLISFAVGAFAMFLIHLKANVPAEKGSIKDEVKKQVEEKSSAIEPTFDFYTLLPEMEVVVPEQKKPKQPIVTSTSPKTDSKAKKTNDSRYMLQVGSFKNASDADAFKAKLAFLGVESKIQKVTIDNKETWHRVQVGPVSSFDKAEALQKQLKDNKIDSLLMRVKKG
jgi:cell division protein FtsN